VDSGHLSLLKWRKYDLQYFNG